MCESGSHLLVWDASAGQSEPPPGTTCACGMFTVTSEGAAACAEISDLEQMWNLPARDPRR